VASAGDVSGDGIGDLIIGDASAGDTPGSNGPKGAAYVIFGTKSGFPASVDVSALDGANGFRVEGLQPNERIGSAVAGAGDLNGDGFADVVIGASYNSEAATYVVFGKASGFPAAVDLAALDGTNGFRVIGDFGSHVSVAAAGDVNGDGFGDLLIGVDNDPRYPGGATFLIYGTASGFPASLNLADLNGANGLKIIGAGRVVSGAGDVNGDGFDDLLIGSPSDSTAYVVFGGPSLTNQSPVAGSDTATTPLATPVNLSAAALLANDTDPDGDALTITAVGAASHGVAVLNADGSVTFTPFQGYVGAAGFAYTVSDPFGATAQGQVDVTVTGTSPAYINRAHVTAAETFDFTGEAASHSVVVGSGAATVIMGSGGGSIRLGAGDDIVLGGPGKETVTFGPGLGTVTGGDGPDVFIFQKGSIADPTTHGGAYDTVTDFAGAGHSYIPGRDFIYLEGFSRSALISFEHDLPGDPSAHLYRVTDGAYSAEFVLDYAGPGVDLSHGQYGFL
jgi:hypothetical protein